MSASAASRPRIPERVLCRSFTGHVGVRPDRRPPLHSTLKASFTDIVMGDQAKWIGLISRPNQPSATLAHPAPTLITPIKSP